MAKTSVSDVKGRIKTATITTRDTDPVIGDEYFDTSRLIWCRWTGDNWACWAFSTTSTSTSTTTSTSTSTSTTSTSTSTSTTTSTSTSTSTTG